MYDTTIGWRFVNKLMKEKYGVDAMPETAENVAVEFSISREDQDKMALASQLKAVAAQKSGYFDAEITPVTIPQKKKGSSGSEGDPIIVSKDEHPRETSMDALSKLKGAVRPDGSVTAGNASGVNDGACALLLADETSAAKNGLTPRARIVGMATAGVAPRIMGIGPAPATQLSTSYIKQLAATPCVPCALAWGRVLRWCLSGFNCYLVAACAHIY